MTIIISHYCLFLYSHCSLNLFFLPHIKPWTCSLAFLLTSALQMSKFVSLIGVCRFYEDLTSSLRLSSHSSLLYWLIISYSLFLVSDHSCSVGVTSSSAQTFWSLSMLSNFALLLRVQIWHMDIIKLERQPIPIAATSVTMQG